MSDKYAALKQAAPYEMRFSRLWERYDEACHGNAEQMRDILELALDALETAERHIARSDRNASELLAEREADKARISQLEAERDALREGEMGDATHSNTRAAADIYFQLVEECNIPAGGSLVEYVDDLRDRIAELESRKVKLPMPYDINEDGERIVNGLGDHFDSDQVVGAICAAGITLETGEQQ